MVEVRWLAASGLRRSPACSTAATRPIIAVAAGSRPPAPAAPKRRRRSSPPRLVENKTRPADRRKVAERIAFQRARQQSPATEIESTERQPTVSCKRITPEVIAEVGQVLRARLVAGDPNFRRSCVAPLVEQATVPAERIRLTGTRSATGTCSSATSRRSLAWCPFLTGLVRDPVRSKPVSARILIINICRIRSGFDPAGKLSRGTQIFPEARKSLAFAGPRSPCVPAGTGNLLRDNRDANGPELGRFAADQRPSDRRDRTTANVAPILASTASRSMVTTTRSCPLSRRTPL